MASRRPAAAVGNTFNPGISSTCAGPPPRGSRFPRCGSRGQQPTHLSATRRRLRGVEGETVADCSDFGVPSPASRGSRFAPASRGRFPAELQGLFVRHLLAHGRHQMSGRAGRNTENRPEAIAVPPMPATRRRHMTVESTSTASPLPDRVPPSLARSVLLWPAIAALALYWTGHLVVAHIETFYFVGFLFNLGSAALLAIVLLAWWWFNRRVPLRSRLYGFLLIVVGAMVVEPFCHPSIGWRGLFMMGLPIVMTAWVVWMITAKKVPSSWRRSGSIVVVGLAFAYFTLIRMDGLDSNLRANMNWRWNPSAEDLFLAEKSSPSDGATQTRSSSHTAESATLRP